jgi:hypothetical protein
VIACPSCKRRVFTPRDLLFATLDGAAQCRFCGQNARLDVTSRWMIACVIALALPNLFLYAGVFYSGHLFMISLFVIVTAWAALSWACSPFLTLEVATRRSRVDRRTSVLAVCALLVAAILIDSYMRARFE